MAKPTEGKFEGRRFDSADDLEIWLTLSTGGSATTVGDWEVDEKSLAAGILGMLQAGLPVWLGSTRDGGAITVTTEIGGVKQRVFVKDAIEWDEYWTARAKQADMATYRRQQRALGASATTPRPPEVDGVVPVDMEAVGRRKRAARLKQTGD